MFSLKGKARSNNNSADKQLKKLRRQDLLELLVEQLTENDRLQSELTESQSTDETLSAQVERLKAKLDEKDELIDRLKMRLDEKDVVLAELFDGLKQLTEMRGVIPRNALLGLEEIAATYYMRQFAHEAPEPEEAVEEDIPEADEGVEEVVPESEAEELVEDAAEAVEPELAEPEPAETEEEPIPESPEDAIEPEVDLTTEADA